MIREGHDFIEVYLPCSGLPSAFALSKSEKILVESLCQQPLYFKDVCGWTPRSMSLQFSVDFGTTVCRTSDWIYLPRAWRFPILQAEALHLGYVCVLDQNYIDRFSGLLQPTEGALTWVLPTISSDRLSGKPSSSPAAKTTRDWRAFYGVPNDWE
jgi:hypothetical protein